MSLVILCTYNFSFFIVLSHMHNILFFYNSAYGWTLMSSIITSGTINCSAENSHCLYSKGRNNINDNFRFARTRPIDLRPVTAVKPLPAAQ